MATLPVCQLAQSAGAGEHVGIGAYGAAATDDGTTRTATATSTRSAVLTRVPLEGAAYPTRARRGRPRRRAGAPRRRRRAASGRVLPRRRRLRAARARGRAVRERRETGGAAA